MDARRELERYEQELVTIDSGNGVTDLVRYCEVCNSTWYELVSSDSDFGTAWSSYTRCSLESQWKSYLHKHHLQCPGKLGVFSSSKETCTDRRSRLSPQILKFSHKQERLKKDF